MVYKIFGKNPLRVRSLPNVGDTYIFVHIPKNAGTSVADALGWDKSWHYTARQYRDMIGRWWYRQYESFSFVRNPWSRFLSLYQYARLEESRYHSAENPESAPYGKHDDYDLLSDASLEECAEYLIDDLLKHDDFINHWRPQSDWVTDEDGNVIVDFIGRVETIDEDFRRIAHRLDLSEDTLPVANKSQSADGYRAAFTDTARKFVAEYYQEDIDRFGYEF